MRSHPVKEAVGLSLRVWRPVERLNGSWGGGGGACGGMNEEVEKEEEEQDGGNVARSLRLEAHDPPVCDASRTKMRKA